MASCSPHAGGDGERAQLVPRGEEDEGGDEHHHADRGEHEPAVLLAVETGLDGLVHGAAVKHGAAGITDSWVCGTSTPAAGHHPGR